MLRLPFPSSRLRQLVQAVAGLMDEASRVPVRAVYFYGSRLHGPCGPSSDLDLIVVLADESGQDDIERCRRCSDLVGQVVGVRVDVSVTREADFVAYDHLPLNTGGVLAFGDELRDRVRPLPADQMVAARLHGAFDALAALYPLGLRLVPPLPAPEGEGEWLGLLGHPQDGLRPLTRLTNKLVRAILNKHTGEDRFILAGPLLVEAYSKEVGDEWSGVIAAIQTRCADGWGGRLPADEQSRQELLALCERALRFGEHFLTHYRPFLVEELRHPNPTRRALARERVVRTSTASLFDCLPASGSVPNPDPLNLVEGQPAAPQLAGGGLVGNS